MCDYYADTQGGDTILNWNRIQTDVNLPLLLGTEIRKGKVSQANRGTKFKDHNHDIDTKC
jgi:hypothetical protein